jgi:hypothetical protein
MHILIPTDKGGTELIAFHPSVENMMMWLGAWNIIPFKIHYTQRFQVCLNIHFVNIQ